MAESYYAQDLNLSTEMTDSGISTGDMAVGRQLYPQLSECISRAMRVDIIVSFLMESGVKILMKDFRAAIDRGVKIRILTGNYLGITQPSALYLIKKECGEQVELRFYQEKNRSFHPKSYIIHYKDYGDLFVGSSNISRSALSSGIEWNYRFSSRKDPEHFAEFCEAFEDLYENHSVVITLEVLKQYAQNWHKPAVTSDLDRYDAYANESSKISNIYEPRGAQIEALCALENTRAEGATKALVMAATGIGKTYLAAFDSKNYGRVLFVAHRDEILRQAARSFRNVRGSEDYGFFNGKQKCNDKSVIFASVATLGRSDLSLEHSFPPDYFQYIVVDEFHHAVNDQYKRILAYFHPQFMLGLTATPDRMDGRSIYELCDYNVAYEIGLKEGINRGLLVPFHYYGIYDETDYSTLHVAKGKYEEKELNEAYIGNVHRHDLIYKYYRKYGSEKALGFCCSREHAEEMAAEFSKRGIPSAAVYSNSSGEFSEDREIAIDRLKKGEIKVIFSIDMFNEGVDIPEIDMVMFLRPTDSPIVFMQQLGRGLRLSSGKKYLNVLDFIGNYEKAGRVRFLLTGRNNTGKEYQYSEQDDFPDGCQIDFDMRLIDLFQEMDKKQAKVGDTIRREYFRIKELIEKRPDRMDLFSLMDDEIYQLAISHAKDNPFRDYLGFLQKNGELSQEEQKIYNGIGREFLNLLETTNMTKVYKMPVLMAFYHDGNVRMNVSQNDLLQSWKAFFYENGNWKDFDKDMTYEKYKAISDKDHIKKIMQMPVHFLQESGKGFFVTKTGWALSLRDELAEVVKEPMFAEQMRDIVEYRVMDYYRRRYKEKKL